MIEEIKMLVEAFGGLTETALYALAFFGVYKLVIYLSTAGATVYIARLVITRLFNWLDETASDKVKEEVLVNKKKK